MTARKPLIAGNWKMNGLTAEAADLAGGIAAWVAANGKSKADVVVCPPFTLLADVAAHPPSPPALLVVGKVVSLRSVLNWWSPPPA